jgi:hypothetical protein
VCHGGIEHGAIPGVNGRNLYPAGVGLPF